MKSETFVRFRVPSLMYVVNYNERLPDGTINDAEEIFYDHSLAVRRVFHLMARPGQYEEVEYSMQLVPDGYDRDVDSTAAMTALCSLKNWLMGNLSSTYSENEDRVAQIERFLDMVTEIGVEEFNLNLNP